MIFFIFIFGLAVGSFINVLVYRLNNNFSPLKGRSFCPKCKHALSWQDNIPLLSFILLKARCRYCHSPISWQYPLVELFTALISVLVFFINPYFLPITFVLITIFVSDLIYMTIPDELIIIGLIVTLPFITFINFITAITCMFFFYLLVLITKGKGMGLGDVKLAFLIGLGLGWPKTLFAIELAFLTGALVGVILIIVGHQKLKSKIAFGPFLSLSLWVMLLWGDKIRNLVLLWLKF